MKKNIYAEMLERIAEGESVSLNTNIAGSEGTISEGLTRSLGEVQGTVDAKGNNMVAPVAVKSGEDFFS